MKKDTSHMIRRAEHFKTILTGEGFLVGLIAGLVVLLYRVLLEFAGKWMNLILQYGRENPVIAGGWFLLLAVMACIVGKLVKWEPMISGSGIPQVEGEMMGKLTQRWWRILPAKFLGGFLSLLAGLSLGREGPSIQIGAMAGKAVSKVLDNIHLPDVPDSVQHLISHHQSHKSKHVHSLDVQVSLKSYF